MIDRERVPVWIKFLVGFHVFAITTATLPPVPREVVANQAPHSPASRFLEFNQIVFKESPTRQYLQSFGLWQAWDMFAPNPSSRDVWSDAIVRLRSGKEVYVLFPRMQKMSLAEKYVMERFRKYNERASHEDFRFLWPSECQWLAASVATNPKDPPVRVYLRRFVRTTPQGVTAMDYFAGFNTRNGPEKWVPRNPEIREAEPEIIFQWIVDQPRLREVKGWKE